VDIRYDFRRTQEGVVAWGDPATLSQWLYSRSPKGVFAIQKCNEGPDARRATSPILSSGCQKTKVRGLEGLKGVQFGLSKFQFRVTKANGEIDVRNIFSNRVKR